MSTERTPQEQALWEEIIYGSRRMPMGPAETSWASWKNGGGPHQDDINPDLKHVTFTEVPPVEVKKPLAPNERFALLVTMSAIKRDPTFFDGGVINQVCEVAAQNNIRIIAAPTSYTGADVQVTPLPHPVDPWWAGMMA